MCFYKTSTEQVAIKAHRSIYGIKALIKKKDELLSPYMFAKWRLGRSKRATNFDPKRNGCSNVNEGLHCYRTIDEAIRHSEGSANEKLFLVEIPKGAMYYQNDTEFCANKMNLLHQIRTPKSKK